MSKYQSITIKETMDNIAHNVYLLPAIQRKFVWETNQIEMLFDSILRNYPINSFMLWKISNKNIKKNYKFYVFIKDFAEKFHEDNPDAPTKLMNNDFFAIIDGQQRMTSLYIGLIGSYRNKRPYKRFKDNQDAMPTKILYLNLSKEISGKIDNEKKYNFKFMTNEELKSDEKINPDSFWFKVGDILDFSTLSDVNRFLIKHKLISNDFATSTLANLFNKINTEELINYYLIEEQDQDMVLDVFLRTNSGGTPLSFSDLLMSITSANWIKFDAREEMNKIRNEIYAYGNPNFDVSQDFILKSILVLSGVDIKFKVRNFGRENIVTFESHWFEIKKSIVATFELLEDLGFNDTLLRAKNAAIPIAYYIYINNLAEIIVKRNYDTKDKQNISKWLSMSLLKGIFGGQSDSVLNTLRKIISSTKNSKFPIERIFDSFKNEPDKNYKFDDDVINSFLDEEYGAPTAGIILNLLYPDVAFEHGKAIAEDHMHPRTQFEDIDKLKALKLTPSQEAFYKNKKNYNSILNLQLLEESANKSKSDESLYSWAKNNIKDVASLFVNDEECLKIQNFENFIKIRRTKLTKEIKKALSI